MNGHGSQYLDVFRIDEENGEHENALFFHFSRAQGNGKIMDEELKFSYELPDGTPVYTTKPELKNKYDIAAKWTEKDLDNLRFWLEGFEELLGHFKKDFEKQEVDEPKYQRLLKQFRPLHDAWMTLRSELFRTVCFCNHSKLDLPEIDYLNDPARTRGEEVKTNQDLERKEVL